VSDDQERPDEAPADAQGAVQAETSSPPWGDDFDASRAWKSIQAGRETEKELKERLRAAEAAWDDEEQAFERVREKFPHWLETDDDSDDDFEDEDATDDQPSLKELEELKAWRAQIDSERASNQYERDLGSLLGDRELSEQGRQVVDALCAQGGNHKKALEQAVENWFAISGESTPKSKKKQRAPHVVTGGTETTGTPDYSDMTREQIDQAMVDRMRALEAQ
jgi:hypothetical protein